MTGRITHGELLPVDDLAGKVDTAKQGYSQRLVAPTGNSADKQGHGKIEVVFVPTVAEALASSLTKHAIKDYTPPA